ncbi:hypothetical protein Tco_0001182 [Tanacetum coccineum]
MPQAVICLTTNQKYNFSKLIFDDMMRHLDAKKKFVMYPRFISVFLDKQLKNVPVPLDHFPINALTKGSGGNHGGRSSSDRSLPRNEDGLTLQSKYDLCVSLCKQEIVDYAMDYKDRRCQDEGRTSFVVLEEKESAEKGVSTEDQVSTVKPDEGTYKPKVSTEKLEVSTRHSQKKLKVSTGDKLDELLNL